MGGPGGSEESRIEINSTPPPGKKSEDFFLNSEKLSPKIPRAPGSLGPEGREAPLALA